MDLESAKEESPSVGSPSVRPQSIGQILYLAIFFFLIIAAFWTLKPLRTSGVIKAFGPDYYPLFKQGVALIIPMIIPVYYLFTSFLDRAQIIYIFILFLSVANISLWWMFEHLQSHWVQAGFFFYVDAFVTIMVTLFFTYLNQIYDPAQAKKSWAYIGCGGILGGIAGSSISGWLSALLENRIILTANLFILPIVFIIHRLECYPSVKVFKKGVLCGKDTKSTWEIFYEGIRVVFRSKYLLCIVSIVGFYEIVSTIIDYQFAEILSRIFKSPHEMAGFHGKVFFIAQIGSLLVQLLMTPYILKRYGQFPALLFLPLTLLLGSVAFMVFLWPLIIIASIGMEAAFAYSINQVSKETLYVPLDNIAKVKGKAFIDMFVFRGAKAIGALILLSYTLWLSRHGFTPHFLMAVNIVAITLWLFSVFYIRKMIGNSYSAVRTSPTIRGRSSEM